jgi:type II secretory pathway pseudopilin PulG
MNVPTQTRVRQSAAQAFTLIELIIVIALTAVLLGLLLIPLVSAIRYTQQAQIVTAAQDAARVTRETITRELGKAVFVFDGTSHPFLSTTAPVAGDDRYTNFLDLPLLDKNGGGVVAHAYNAKLDFVLAKVNDGGTVDPTTNEPITYALSKNGGSAVISNPSLVFPTAPGTSAVRYFIGLKDPTKSYNNTREGKATGSGDNTYILYRAQYQPYTAVTDANGKVTGQQADVALFATRDKLDAAGRPVKDTNGNVIQIPELDDPDFFRYVGANDVNWLDDAHKTYGTTTLPKQDVLSHNNRVDKWREIAKPVIPGPNVDLILQPHDAQGKLTYDAGAPAACTAAGCAGVSHTGVAHDPVAGGYYPIVNTSVTFRPATVSGDATPGTTTEYNSQAVAATGLAGYNYIPTVYTATSHSWALPFHVSFYPGTPDQAAAALGMYYDTDISSVTDTTNNYVAAGDVLEYRHTSADTDPRGTLVYNVTGGYPVTVATGNSASGYTLGGTDFVPVAINPDSGTLNFATPSLPNGPTDRLSRAWVYGLLDSANSYGGVDANDTLDLTKPVGGTVMADSPLEALDSTGKRISGVSNAHIIPGSVRISGPDTTSGPGMTQGQNVPYQEISANSISSNSLVGSQFSVDYAANTLTFSKETVAALTKIDFTQDTTFALLSADTAHHLSVIYDYQANMTRPDSSKPLDVDNPVQPMQVKVDYQTRDLIDVSIGVRIYDVSTNRAQVIPSEIKVKIGNSNR